MQARKDSNCAEAEASEAEASLCAAPTLSAYFNEWDSSDAQTQAEKLGVDVSGATIVDPETATELEQYVEDLVEARKKKVRCFRRS